MTSMRLRLYFGSINATYQEKIQRRVHFLFQIFRNYD